MALLGYLWAAPTTLLAILIFLVPCWALGQIRPARWRDGAWEWEIVPGSWWGQSWRGWRACTLGWVIFFAHDAGTGDSWSSYLPSARHERRHVWQAFVLGPLYLPVWAILTLVYGYTANPLEVDARAHEG